MIGWCWFCQRTEFEGHKNSCPKYNLADPWGRLSIHSRSEEER